MAQNSIGCYHSVLTKTGFRYEGTLVKIDIDVMYFRDVKKMGTEGRRNGINEIPPLPQTYKELKMNIGQI